MGQRSERLARGAERGPRKPEKVGAWIVLYDADCGFCAWVLARLLSWDRAGRLRPSALQGAEARRLLADVPDAERMASWHLISPTGVRDSGGAAVVEVLRLLPGGRAPAGVLGWCPGLTEEGYRWVAEHRARLSRLVPARAKRDAQRRVRDVALARGMRGASARS